MGILWYVVGVTWSADYTIMAHVYIFSGLPGAIIVIYKLLAKNRVDMFEKLGTIIALVGCAISILDPHAIKSNQLDLNEDER